MPITPTETALFCASCSQRFPAVRASEFLRRGLWVVISLVVHPELRNTQFASAFLPKVLRDLDPLVLLNQVCQSRLKCSGELELRNLQTTARASGPLLPWKKPSRVRIGLVHESQSILIGQVLLVNAVIAEVESAVKAEGALVRFGDKSGVGSIWLRSARPKHTLNRTNETVVE